MTSRIFHVESEDEFSRAFPVIVQLRPRLDLAMFRDQVRKQMTQGYRLVALEEAGEIRALGGYRLLDYLWVGRAMYVDDLITDERVRSHGHGEQLFGWLRDLATAEGCLQLHLDSGLHRARAHRFYFRQGMIIDDFHFVLPLG
ncbi:MAG: GNAT family N-acetyltransferase [Gemmatimonadota bacterium]